MLDDFDDPFQIVVRDPELLGEVLEMPHREVFVELGQDPQGQRPDGGSIGAVSSCTTRHSWSERRADPDRVQPLDLLEHRLGFLLA